MGFNTGRPTPSNTFDWSNTSLTDTQQTYSKIFTLNEANAADTLRLCNAGMEDADGTITTDTNFTGSGFSFGDAVELSITESSISLATSGVTQLFNDRIATDPVNGLADLIEFNRYANNLLDWNSSCICADGYEPCFERNTSWNL